MIVSIVIPVFNRLAFTRQCLDRIWRNTASDLPYEVIIVDNASSDDTASWFPNRAFPRRLCYHRNPENLGFGTANNIGARLAGGEFLLFLNNDTLVQPGWLTEMLSARRSDTRIGIVGIKQLFPYTNTIYHTGIVFTPEGNPVHLYPHLDASLPQVNEQREYQAVTGACLLIDRDLFEECGGFDETYRNGYEDVDLCLRVRQRGRRVVCCTRAFIYHYGQISEGRTDQDEHNAALFKRKWSGSVRPDRDEYLARDRLRAAAPRVPAGPAVKTLAEDCIYLADSLDQGSALTWVNAELALAMQEKGLPVFVNGASPFSPTLSAPVRRRLDALALRGKPTGGAQIKWSHYRPRHLHLELAGDTNLEFFVINYVFAATAEDPWDVWLQCVRQNHHRKIALSDFCRSVLLHVGVPERECAVWHPGYSPEIETVVSPRRSSDRFRLLTVTNSHDLERYNTAAVIDAFDQAFSGSDDVQLVVKDYGASSGNQTIRRLLASHGHAERFEYVAEFSDKRELIRLYKSCDAIVSAHRGEGFGLKILDGMACGLPVIAPLFGGPAAYCRTDNCFPVDFRLVPVGDCLDTQSLRIRNRPMWAEVNREHLWQQMRAVYENRERASRIGSEARALAMERFSWATAVDRLLQITTQARADRVRPVRTGGAAAPAAAGGSPYWLGIRVSVVIPTHNRKDKLVRCLDALAGQSILPWEYEVIVVDDGSSDGTSDAVGAFRAPYALRYLSQPQSGPGAARNLAIQHAAGELVLFLGDDIYADEQLLEQHLEAHARSPDPGLAILGHIDWPEAMTPNAVMECVCGEAKLQFAYSEIPFLHTLDHRFFYTSNISLKRAFLLEAADAGIQFDPCFQAAAFEDAEYAFRLQARGLRIRYAAAARAAHDHWMDLTTFAAREYSAGAMAVVFFRKHPGEDQHLQVRWIADVVDPAKALLQQPEFLSHLEAFDAQTDVFFRSLAASLEELRVLNTGGSGEPLSLSSDRLGVSLNNVFRIIFDVERTRGKIDEWFRTVEDPARRRVARTLGAVMRKLEFLQGKNPITLAGGFGPLEGQAVAALSGRLAGVERPSTRAGRLRQRAALRIRRLIASRQMFVRVSALDRFIESRLQAAGRSTLLTRYRRLRNRVRRSVWPG